MGVHLLCCQGRQAIARADRHRHHFRNKRHRLFELLCSQRQQFLQFVKFSLIRVLGFQTGTSPDLLDHREQSALHTMGQALKSQTEMWLAFDSCLKFMDDAGFSNSRDAGNKYGLAISVRGIAPALLQKGKLGASPYQRGYRSCPVSLEAARVVSDAVHSKSTDALRQALQNLHSKVFLVEATANQLTGSLSNHDRIRQRKGLKSSRDVKGFANCARRYRRIPPPRFAYHDNSGANSDANHQRVWTG